MIDPDILSMAHRKAVCTRCRFWDGACEKWECETGAEDPWTGLDGVCPMAKWALGRRKDLFSRNISRQNEDT